MQPCLNSDPKTRRCCENAFKSFRLTGGSDYDPPGISRNMTRTSLRGCVRLWFPLPDLIYLTSFLKVHTGATVDRDWYTSERIHRNGSARQSSVTDPRGSEGPESTSGGQANGVPVRKPGASTFADKYNNTTAPLCSVRQEPVLIRFFPTLQPRL